MRQLDLFGSLFDPPPSDEKPEVVQPVPKGQGESGAEDKLLVSAASIATPPTDQDQISSENSNGEGDLQNEETENSKALFVNLSLFNDQTFAADVPVASANNNTSVDQSSEVEQAQISGVIVAEPNALEPVQEEVGEVSPENATLNGSSIPEEVPVSFELAEVVVVDNETGEETFAGETALAETAPDLVSNNAEPIIATPLTAPLIKKRPGRPKKVKAPELETSGTVIFTDGKITVKLKNRNPFTEVTSAKEKVKKEKVKKAPQKRGRKSFKEIDAEVDLIEIPEDEILFQKQYYPISEVAKWFRVNTSLLRFWENEFDVLKPRKNRKGDRLFRPEDVKNLQLIYQLLRQRKYTIEGAKEYIKTNKKKADIQLHLTNTLQKFKSFLLDLKANLQT